jgi:hypothetical protein
MDGERFTTSQQKVGAMAPYFRNERDPSGRKSVKESSIM